MNTKIKFLNIFLGVLVMIAFISTLNLSPELVSAQNQGMCISTSAPEFPSQGSQTGDPNLDCQNYCADFTDQGSCNNANETQVRGPSGDLLASPVLAQINQGNLGCGCAWIQGPASETCSDGIQNQDETGIDSGGVCLLPPPPSEPSVCAINTFSVTNSSIAYNTGTTLNFSLSEAFDWDITTSGGAVLPSPRTGNNSGQLVSTGNLTQSQSYVLNCYYKEYPTDDVVRVVSSSPRTVIVQAQPGESTCDDIDANNYGGALPCTYPPAAVCEDPVATNNGGALPCTYPTPPGNYYLTPSITTSVSCVPVGQTSYTATVSWPTVNNNIRIFIDDDVNTPPGFDKVVDGNSGSTPAPAGFAQRMPPPAPTVLTLLAGTRYYSFIQNNSTYDGPTVNWKVDQCDPTYQAVGYVDAANCSIVGGWTYDPDYPNESNSVHFYKNNVFYGSIVADDFRADLPGDKYHAFTYTTPDEWKTGSPETINAYAIDLNGDGNPNLTGSSFSIDCPVPPGEMWGALVPENISCDIQEDQSSCTASLTWAISDPEVAPTTLTGTGGMTTVELTDTTTTPQSGSLSVTIPFGDPDATGGRTFTLNNNGEILDNSEGTAGCDSGLVWLGGICTTPPPGGPCSNGATNPPTCTTGDGGSCINGATNPPTCTTNNGACINGATNPPLCAYPILGPSSCGDVTRYTCDSGVLGNEAETPGEYTWTCGADPCRQSKTGGKVPIFIED